MLRTFVVKEKMDLQTLRGHLLDARFRGDQADVSLDVLKQLNPHADLAKLTPGTVLLVPDAPGFKPSASASVSAKPFDEFQKSAASALDEAIGKLKAGNEVRAAERAAVSAFVKGAVFRRIVADNEGVRKQAEEALETIAEQEKLDSQATENFEAASRSAMAALAQLGKLIG
jgi:hypothetical protein